MKVDRICCIVGSFVVVNIITSVLIYQYINRVLSESQQVKEESLNKHRNSVQTRVKNPRKVNEFDYGLTSVERNNNSKLGFSVYWGLDAPKSIEERYKILMKYIILEKAVNYRDWDPKKYLDLKNFERRRESLGSLKRRNDYCMNSDMYNILHPNNTQKRYIHSL